MQLTPNAEQEMLADSALRFVQNNYDFTQRAKRLQKSPHFDTTLWNNFIELGWVSLLLSEENGGFGGTLNDIFALQQKWGEALVQEPFISSVVCLNILDQCVLNDQLERCLTAVLSGEKTISLALEEVQTRYQAASIQCHAEPCEQGYRLNGEKTNIVDGDGAHAFLVASKIGDELAVFLLEAELSGLVVEPLLSADDRPNCHLSMNNVVVPESARLNMKGESALTSLSRACNLGAALTCADMVGSMQTLLTTTVEYAKQREQFGQPIGKFQVLQHRMADMFIALERARSMLGMLGAVYEGDANQRGTTQQGAIDQAVSAAKYQINQSARFIGQQAVQIHGGIGTTHELPVGHYFKRLIVNEAAFGDSHFHLRRYTQTTYA